jgi:hypothetical protein
MKTTCSDCTGLRYSSIVFCGYWLTAASLFAQGTGSVTTPPNPPPPSWTTSFSAVWNDEAPATTLYLADDLADLVSAMTTFDSTGQRLAAFESWRIGGGGERRYAGLFRAGYGERLLVTGLDAATFSAKRQQQFALGRRLIDVEAQLVDGERRYAGLWAPGSGSEMTVELGAAPFEAQWQALSATHRLVAFDTFSSKDLAEAQVFGVFRGGPEAPGTALAVGLDWESFESLVETYGLQGKRLVDFEASAFSSVDHHFSGRWVPATPARDWLGVFYSKSDLSVSDLLFKSGHEFSATSTPPGGFLPAPTASRMDMLDLETTGYLFSNQIIHGRPLHDAGTPGPPRPGGGG